MDANTSPSGVEPSKGTRILLYIRNLLERKVRNLAGVKSGALAKNLLRILYVVLRCYMDFKKTVFHLSDVMMITPILTFKMNFVPSVWDRNTGKL
jgi:hypothetical protein